MLPSDFTPSLAILTTDYYNIFFYFHSENLSIFGNTDKINNGQSAFQNYHYHTSLEKVMCELKTLKNSMLKHNFALND
jgi:hypothetical protein